MLGDEGDSLRESDHKLQIDMKAYVHTQIIVNVLKERENLELKHHSICNIIFPFNYSL